MHSLKLPSKPAPTRTVGPRVFASDTEASSDPYSHRGSSTRSPSQYPCSFILDRDSVFARRAGSPTAATARDACARLTRGKIFLTMFPQLGQSSQQRRSWCTVVRQWLKLRPQFFALNCSGKAKQKTVGTHCNLRVRPSAAAAHKARPAASSGPSRIKYF